jgi:hypothetical protein
MTTKRMTKENYWACANALSHTLNHYRREDLEYLSSYTIMIDTLDLIMDKLDLDNDERANLIF